MLSLFRVKVGHYSLITPSSIYTMTHQAAWIKSKNAVLEVGQFETPSPGPEGLLVKVEAIAFSPVESKVQRFEVHPIKYPHILGFSFAGTVQAVGPDAEGFAKGDRITTLRPHSKLNDNRFGAFQQYALASVHSSAKLLPNTTLEAGAATILNLATITAAFSVFQGLNRPSLSDSPSSKGQKILVYGGSSSCGGLAIRYAAAAGYEVVTTSSPKNMNDVASLKPNVIIDHTKPAGEVVKALQGHGSYYRILDTIGVPSVTKILADYLSSVGGGSYNTLIPVLPGTDPLPDNVERKFESYGWAISQDESLQEWFYNKLLPKGLESGIIVPTKPRWIEGGLHATQRALDMMHNGEVSGCKFILSPW
ncbi:Dehydrogenase azaJ [Pseudocercospora fuligena]|uniref:Dehydrogenase azaJ n=1 Tax=Pseudocercospora fuligena TaxID=685502 RepID=A0A8H6VFD4_9PEZI|nr:Dehydrogenase azaJ [Pseudocercospora fuligena]